MTTKKIIKDIVPPILFRNLKKLKNRGGDSTSKTKSYKVKNTQVSMIFSDPLKFWSEEMVEGSYDQFIYQYLDRFGFKDFIAIEIGAHVGYHALKVAEKVGDGHVFAFEPNPANRKRFEDNIKLNHHIQSKITVSPFAVSETDGEAEFVFSTNIDEGFSSGSHLMEMETPLNQANFEELGFIKNKVNLIALDKYVEINNIDLKTLKFIKVDVEGAESMVFNGAFKTFQEASPVVVIEIHSILNMFSISQFFRSLGYKMELLKQEEDGRIIIGCHK